MVGRTRVSRLWVEMIEAIPRSVEGGRVAPSLGPVVHGYPHTRGDFLDYTPRSTAVPSTTSASWLQESSSGQGRRKYARPAPEVGRVSDRGSESVLRGRG